MANHHCISHSRWVHSSLWWGVPCSNAVWCEVFREWIIIHVTCLDLPNFINPQFHSSLEVFQGCVMQLNSIKLSAIAVFAADIILLLIMLSGLYRLRRGGGYLMGLGRLLWNQVGWERFYCTLDLRVYFLRKGVVWLLLAVTAELPPMVSRCISLPFPFSHRHFSCRCSLFWTLTVNFFYYSRLWTMLTEFGFGSILQHRWILYVFICQWWERSDDLSP